MLIPVGLSDFAAAYPDRIFDVGIAEQHATTMAAGLAFGGLHPVVAVYATFLNRAFDQLLMDCALHKAGVTFVLDRSGITGPDGASHHGMWDMTLTGMVPACTSAPRATASRCAQRCARRSTSATPERDPLPEGHRTGAHRGRRTPAHVDVLREPSRGDDGSQDVDVLSSPWAAWPRPRSPSPRSSRRRVCTSVWSTRAGPCR